MAESQEKSDMNTILFTNLQLLGLDVIGMESSYKIPFNKDMFNLPNKAGSEAVLYFLFGRLNPSLCKEQFRDCWPVLDRKTELQFRKVCTSWLINIQKEAVDSRLPRVNAALLLSPGGGKFIHLLYSFSTYVLVNVMKSEHGWRSQDSIIYPTLQPRTSALGAVMKAAVHDSLTREKKQFFENLYLFIEANRQWKDYTNELVKDFRCLAKSNRDLEHEKQQQVNILAENCVKQGIQLPAKRSITMFDSDQDSSAIARGQRLEKMKSQWKSLTEFNDRVMREREVFHSIVDNESSTCVLDGSDIGVRVPGLLLRERSEEIHKRGIDNVYNGGALNLVSLIQLWNISLNMYKEQLTSESLPSVCAEVPRLKARVHEHQSHLRHIQELRERLRNNALPKLRNSIAQLQKQLNSQCISAPSTDKDTNLGLILTAPTPPIAAVTRNSLQADESPPGLVAGLIADTDSTPDALQNVSSKIEAAVKKRVETSADLRSVTVLSRLKSTQNRLADGRNVQSHIPKSQLKKDTRKSSKSQYSTKIVSKKNVNAGLREGTSVGSNSSHETKQTHPNPRSTIAMSAASATPRSSKRDVMDILANTIVDSVLNSSDSTLLSDISVDTLLDFCDFGAEAFQTKHVIGRSPVKGSTSLQDVRNLQVSPACQNAFESCSNQDLNLSLSQKSVYSLDSKGGGSCDAPSETIDWSNNAHKDGISVLHKGHAPRSALQRNTSVVESASALSVTGDLLKSVSKADKSDRVQLMDCVFSHSERTPRNTQLDEWDENAISKALTPDRCLVNLLDGTNKPSTTHTDADELLIPKACHRGNSFVNRGRSSIESPTTFSWEAEMSDLHLQYLQFPKTSNHSVHPSPSSKMHQNFYNSTKTNCSVTEIKSPHVNKRRLDVEDMSHRQPGDGQDDWDQPTRQAPLVTGGGDSDAETEESVENRADSGTGRGGSADFSGLHRLAPVSIELGSLSASDILTATKCNILDDSHEQILSSDYQNVQIKDKIDSLTARVKLQLDTESQTGADSCGISKHSLTEQRIKQISSGSSFQDHLQLEDLDAKTQAYLINLDREEDLISELDLHDSYIPLKQGICLDSRSPLKQSLTPSKDNLQPLIKNDLRPTSTVSSSDSIQAKLAQLQQKVLDILGTSLDDTEDVEEQPQPHSDRSETTAACGISPDDDDILSTDLLNTDLLDDMDDFL